MKSNLTDKIYTFNDADFDEIDKKAEHPLENCGIFFHRFKYKCEYKLRVVKYEKSA